MNDISGSGQVASQIQQPILNSAGLTTAILPTLILSHHTGNGAVMTHSLKEDFHFILQDWLAKQRHFSVILTGYFGEYHQISSIIDFYKEQLKQQTSQDSDKTGVLIVDPVMGDHGQLYHGFNHDFVVEMRRLMTYAHIICPNLTEACLLAGIDYPDIVTEDILHHIGQLLQQQGAHHIIMTGIQFPHSPDKIGFFYYPDSQGDTIQNFGTSRVEGRYFSHQYNARAFFGTGDLFVALLCVFYMTGYDIEGAIQLASEQMAVAVASTVKRFPEMREEIYFQSVMKSLTHYIE